MDAIKFFKEYERMCKAHDDCTECSLKDIHYNTNCSYNPVRGFSDDNLNEVVRAVEDWSRENPEVLEKKYVIEISRMTPTGKFQVKGTHVTFTKAELDFFEEYKGSEE